MILGNRIIVIGPCGSGKSTLASLIAPILDLPVIHLDYHFWKPNWVPSEQQEWIDLQKKLVENERWIIEGNYAATLEIRLLRATSVIWLDFPRHIFLKRAVLRSIKHYGKVRPDLPDACNERFELEFYRFVWNFQRDQTPKIDEAIVKCDNVLRFRRQREVSAFLKELKRCY